MTSGLTVGQTLVILPSASEAQVALALEYSQGQVAAHSRVVNVLPVDSTAVVAVTSLRQEANHG